MHDPSQFLKLIVARKRKKRSRKTTRVVVQAQLSLIARFAILSPLSRRTSAVRFELCESLLPLWNSRIRSATTTAAARLVILPARVGDALCGSVVLAPPPPLTPPPRSSFRCTQLTSNARPLCRGCCARVGDATGRLKRASLVCALSLNRLPASTFHLHALERFAPPTLLLLAEFHTTSSLLPRGCGAIC